MNLEVEGFELTNALLVVDYYKDNVYFAESFPIETFQQFIESENYLEYHNFRQRYDGQYDEVEGMITWERYLSEFVSEQDVKEFLMHQLKLK